MSAPTTRAQHARHGRRQRTTLPLDRELLARAQTELGTGTITETVEAALRLAAGSKPRALFASGDPELASRVDEVLAEGFGER